MSIWKALCLRQDHHFGSISGLKDKSVKLATRERREVSVALTLQLADLLNWITASGRVDRKDAWKRYEHIDSLSQRSPQVELALAQHYACWPTNVAFYTLKHLMLTCFTPYKAVTTGNPFWTISRHCAD